MTVSRTYLKGLNSLRAIAALSVCLYHFTDGSLPKIVIPAAKQLFARGWVGVDIFFVISGFVIPYSLSGKSYKANQIIPYLRKRIVRINPPAYVALLLVIGQWIIIDKFIQHGNTYSGHLTVVQIIHNMLFTVPFTDYAWINGVFWTLAVEFEFYLLIGIFFSPMFERNHIGWLVLIYLVVFTGQWLPIPGLVKQSICVYSPLFAIGSVALLWYQKRCSLVVCAGLLLLFGLLAAWRLSPFIMGIGIGTAVAIVALRVAVPGLDLIGKMSYSFYLVHAIIGTTSEFVLIKLIAPDSDLHKFIILLLALLVTLVGSYGFYYFIERPFIQLAKTS